MIEVVGSTTWFSAKPTDSPIILKSDGRSSLSRSPSALRIALRTCGLSRSKVAYLHDLARHFVEERLNVKRWERMSDDELITELTQVRGIGRWTAEMFLVFSLARPDVLALDDAGLLRAAGWALIISEPESAAFSDRTHDVAVFTLAYVLFFAADGLIIFLLLSILVAVIAARRREAALLENIADGVVAMDAGRVVTAWNRSAGTLTGWTPLPAAARPQNTTFEMLCARRVPTLRKNGNAPRGGSGSSIAVISSSGARSRSR